MAEQASKVSGLVQIDGIPAQRTVRAFGYSSTSHDIDGQPVNLSKSLGHAVSDSGTGEYTIDLLAGYDQPIFVVAFDDYGTDFIPDMVVAVGDRIHPATPNGHVWECTSAGILPSEEPTWIVDTETAQLYGTASMIARPFYRPMVHGPVSPEVTGVAEPTWTPANLFSNNQAGAWYDPSDLTTLFQDAAGTTPVTSDGDPVGAMLDKSGNNLHAKQSGATLRPIYRTDGTKHWIEFDGSKVLTIDAPKADQRFMHDGTGLTCIGGYRFGSTAGEDGAFPIFGSDSGSSGKGGGFLSYDTRSQYNFSQSVRYFSTPVGSISYVANMRVDNVVPVNTDCSFEFSASAEKSPNLEVLQGGVVVGSDDYITSLYTGDASYNYDIFAYGNGNGKTKGRLYGLLVINTILTRDDAGELTAFMENKAGI